MSGDGARWRWRVGVTIPVFVAVLSWVLDAFNARFLWSRILDGLGWMPVFVYWILAVVAAFTAGWRVGASRLSGKLQGKSGTGKGNRVGATEGAVAGAVDAELEETVPPPKPTVPGTSAGRQGDGSVKASEEADADAKDIVEPAWIDRFDAKNLVRQSNYWSRVKRRSALDKIEAKRDYEEYDIEPDTDPYDLESAEIAPPRHTPDVDALLQHFWDDHPAGREENLYHRPTLMEWLEEQAYEVKLPTDYD